MDSISHGLAGTVLGYCGFQQKAGRAALWTSIAASQFPDSDILLMTIDPELYLRWHRGPTHSLPLLPLWALFIAWIFWELFGRKHYRVLWLTAFLSLLIHVGMDWMTSYGTMLFSPFSDRRFELAWVFILDPLVWATLALTLWAVWRTARGRERNAHAFRSEGADSVTSPSRGAVAARVGLAVFGAYVLANGVSHALAVRAAGREPGTVRAAAYPVPLQPWQWTVVRQDARGIHWVYEGQNHTFQSFEDDVLVPQAESTEAVKLFRWFADFPVIEKFEQNGRTVLRYRDLRFRSPMPWGAVREGTFVVAKALFDGDGKLIVAGLTGEDRRE